MKKIVWVVIIMLWGLGSYSQTPSIVYDDLVYNELGSSFLNLGTKAVIGFYSRSDKPAINQYYMFDYKLIVSQNGEVLSHRILDSTDTYGFQCNLPVTVLKDSFLFQFGSLKSTDESERRMIIRKTDLNLNLISDTVFNFSNFMITIHDVIEDSNTFLVSGGMYLPDTSFAFIFRINSNLEIIDSVVFQQYMPFNFGMKLSMFEPGKLQMRLTSPIHRIDLALEFEKSPLKLLDTLHEYGLDPTWVTHARNCYGASITDSTYLMPIEAYRGIIDTFYHHIGWLKFNHRAQIIDTILPYADTVVIADRIGYGRTMLIHNDTIAMTYSHNDNYLGYPPSDSTNIALILCDLQGKILKVSYFGTGYKFIAENLLRFDNGNYLAMANRKNWGGGIQNQTYGFVAWLLDKNGDIIQQIEMPIREKIKLQIYPNPTTESLTIQTKDNTPLPQGTLQIFNMQGALQMELAIPKHQSQLQLNLSHLPAGLYLGRIVGSSGEGGGFRFVKE